MSAQKELEVTFDGSQSGYVEPSRDCPHVDEFLRDPQENNVNTICPCKGCEQTKENWLCLTCYEANCSRFQNGHAAKHFESTKHPLAISFSDLSVWCYACDTYIKNRKLSLVFRLAHNDKFGRNPGEALENKGSVGHTNQEAIKEFFDDEKDVIQKVKELANLIKSSKHTMIYTGAGVSTSAKIPDYRGPMGVWTLRDKGLNAQFDITLEEAIPTLSHMSIVKLQEKGYCKLLVSTNVDGLHRRSGITAQGMAELHGNIYRENCGKCKKEFLRKFDVTKGRDDHKTGRKCDACSGDLLDSIINFGENLPMSELEKAADNANASDLALVLGTSMLVSPANQFPLQAVENGGKMVIVNLQKTPYDRKAAILIHERTDKVMELLMKELQLEIPQYQSEKDSFKNLDQLNLNK